MGSCRLVTMKLMGYREGGYGVLILLLLVEIYIYISKTFEQQDETL